MRKEGNREKEGRGSEYVHIRGGERGTERERRSDYTSEGEEKGGR